MTYVGDRLDWAITVAKYFEVSFTDAYRAIPYLIQEEAIEAGAITSAICSSYIFTLIGAVPTIVAPENPEAGKRDLPYAGVS